MDNQKTILLSVEHLRKIYNSRFGSNQVEALKSISFSVDQGEFIAVMGESGSGKTTLLNLLAALDRPTEGKILLAEKILRKSVIAISHGSGVKTWDLSFKISTC